MEARKDGPKSGPANAVRVVGVGEHRAVLRQGVEVWGLDETRFHEAVERPAVVVAKDHHDVGAVGGRLGVGLGIGGGRKPRKDDRREARGRALHRSSLSHGVAQNWK